MGDVSLCQAACGPMNGRIWPQPDPFTVVTGQPRCVGGELIERFPNSPRAAGGFPDGTGPLPNGRVP